MRCKVRELKSDGFLFKIENLRDSLTEPRVDWNAKQNFHDVMKFRELIAKLIINAVSQNENYCADVSSRGRLFENDADKKAERDDGYAVEEEENPDKEEVAVLEKCSACDDLEINKHGDECVSEHQNDKARCEPGRPVEKAR